ncbi:MAG TPA: right-handed parallel beta-helix repeat-containing protein [Chthoniobacterales bacterium]|nr:right-handed parallel beta-helix repeat-containing protein [Chthoniobacterales bacterium]
MKHTHCPDCGAESAVESVVVAEKVKAPSVPPPLPTPPPQRSDGQAKPPDFQQLLRSIPWPVYAGAAAVVLLILIFALRSPRPSLNQTAKDENGRQAPTPQQGVSPGEMPSTGPTAPPGAPNVGPGAPTFPPVVPGTVVGNLAELISGAGQKGTVKLKPGLYQGGVVIAQPVQIIGDNTSGGQVFIQSDTKDAIAIRSKGVVLQNVQVLFNGSGEVPAISVTDSGELETDGVKVMSSSNYGVVVRGNGVIKATASTFTTTNGTAAQIDRQSRANFTKCSFTDAQTGLAVGNGSSTELSSCAFERNGARTGRGAIMTVSGDKTNVTIQDCRFGSNPSGITVGEGGSITISNSQFKDNGISSTQGNSSPGLIQVRSAGIAKLDNDTFEANSQGIVATNGGTLELNKCRFDGNGLQTRGELVANSMAICGNGNGTIMTVRDCTINGSASYNVAVIWSAKLSIENTEISGARTVGLLVGDRNGLPASAEVKHCKFMRNTTGIGVCSGSSATVTDSESRENSEGAIALDRGTHLSLNKTMLIGNRDHGICAYGGAAAEVADSQIENNARGAQSGMQQKSSATGSSLVLLNTRVAGNQMFGAGAYSKNQLTLNAVTFENNGKTNVYKESGAIVRTDAPLDPGSSPASNPDSDQSNDGQSRSTKKVRRTKQQRGMTDEDARRIIRRFFPRP